MIELKRTFLPISQLFSNTIWLFSAELLAKLSRIVTIITLAVSLTPVSYGTAMLALACHDMLALLLRAGSGTQIIRCDDEQLSSYARNGAVVQWAICIFLATIQFFIASTIASWYDNPDLVLLLQVMALTYVFYPWVSVKVFLVQRACKMRHFSIRYGFCVTAENFSIAAFVWWGADLMAVAYGKIVFSILWLIMFGNAPVKHYGIGFEPAVIKTLLGTSGQLFSTELLRSLRLHADTFIAAKVMSPELFGLYSFAKNAGIGLSQSISNVFNNALYPFLCRVQRENTLNDHKQIIYLTALAVGFLFILQALFVPLYVPLLFDQKWQYMAPVVSIMCLIALPSIIVDTCCCFDRVRAQLKAEMTTRFIYLIFSLLTLFIYSPTEPMTFALSMLASGVLGCGFIYFGHRSIEKIADGMRFLDWRKSHEY